MMVGWRSRLGVVLVVLLVPLELVHAQFTETPGVGDYSDRGISMAPAGGGSVDKTPVTKFASSVIEGAFTGGVVRVRFSGPAPDAWFRITESASGVTTDWMPAAALGGKDSSIRLFAVHSDQVFQDASVEVAIGGSNVELLEAAVFDNRLDEDAQAVEWDLSQTERGQTYGKIIPPHLITRSDWGAEPFIGTPVPLARPSYDYITIHHAACCGAYTYQEGIRQVKGIQDFHQNGRGWSDIGYHFLLDQSGRLYQGRPFMNPGATLDDTPILALGAHVGGFNTGNIGVSMLGCYHPPEGAGCRDVLSPQALDSLITVIAFLSERYGIPPSRIRGHRDWAASTACPGDNNYRLIPEIKQRVAELLRTGNAPVGAASLTADSDADGVVRLAWQFTRDDGIVRYRIEREANGEVDILYAADSAEDLTLTDARARSAGATVYRLTARNADGRWATLAESEVEVAHPDGFELSQSFPNPSTGQSTIRYYLEQEGYVSLKLYDALGRTVRVFVDHYQQQGRWYAVPVETTNLTPGQYYYRLQVEGFAGIVYDDSKGLTVTR